jgi:hypothetical protein
MKEVLYDQHQAGLTMQPSEAYDTNFVEDVSTIGNIYISPGVCTIKLLAVVINTYFHANEFF